MEIVNQLAGHFMFFVFGTAFVMAGLGPLIRIIYLEVKERKVSDDS